ncbi:helix-turn-helix domain-containing protein [Pseudomonas sp.]|uniref:helix-turn-helix domain-containing protein n=1 Tax=Pseudomonas sp. TaxID=306 RepID=UPI0025F2E65C|nr:helix-turn-helix domain-containing protein [Pseudomonas sp.]
MKKEVRTRVNPKVAGAIFIAPAIACKSRFARQLVESVMSASPGVYRMAAIIETFVSRPRAVLSFAEIVRETGIKRATCHALLIAMVETGLLCRDENKKFSLGHAMANLVLAARQTSII